MSAHASRIVNALGYVHLVYLGLLPAVATFSLLVTYGIASPLLLLLAGTAAVGVYLAVIISYTPLPGSLGWALLILLDGPVWVVFSIRPEATPFAFAIEGFLVDGTAIWISILVLAIRSPAPTRQQRLGSIGFMLAALAATAWLVWPYYRDALSGHWEKECFLVLGIIEALVINYRVVKRDVVVRNNNLIVAYLIILILTWVASMIAGNVLHELR